MHSTWVSIKLLLCICVSAPTREHYTHLERLPMDALKASNLPTAEVKELPETLSVDKAVVATTDDKAALTLSLHSITTHSVKARTPSSGALVSLGPADFMIAAIGVTSVSFFWPSSPDHDEAVLMDGLSAALGGYPTLVGRLHAGGKVGGISSSWLFWLSHGQVSFPMGMCLRTLQRCGPSHPLEIS